MELIGIFFEVTLIVVTIGCSVLFNKRAKQVNQDAQDIRQYYLASAINNANIITALFPTIIEDLVDEEQYREAEKCKAVLRDAQQVIADWNKIA